MSEEFFEIVPDGNVTWSAYIKDQASKRTELLGGFRDILEVSLRAHRAEVDVSVQKTITVALKEFKKQQTARTEKKNDNARKDFKSWIQLVLLVGVLVASLFGVELPLDIKP